MLKAGVIGIVLAVIGVAVTILVGDAVSGPLLVTPPGGEAPEEVSIGLGAFSTVFGGLFGTGIAAVCKRFLSNPVAAFLGICAVGLIVYAILPFTAAESTSTALWLNAMHLVAAVPIVGLLTTELRKAHTP